MNREVLWADLKPVVVRKGHYVFSSGQHGDYHSNFVSSHLTPEHRARLVRECCKESITILGSRTQDAVIAGTGCGYWYAAMVAEQLGVPSIYAERGHQGDFVLRRDQSWVIHRKKHVLLLDDVISTGASSQQLCELFERNGAEILGVLYLLNRGYRSSSFFTSTAAVPIHALFHEPMETWPREECPLCKAGISFSTEYGKGAEEMLIHGQPQKS